MSQLSRLRSAVFAVALGMLVGACTAPAKQNSPPPGTTPPSASPATNKNAALLQDFKTRIDAYLKLHNELEKESPPLKATEHPEKITASQDALAAKLRVARKDAKPGEIFTPPIRSLFRRLMHPELKGEDGPETKAAMKEDKPVVVAMTINGAYPSSAPLVTTPPNLLASLPPLPDELEYRFVGKHLILRDVHANLIVDYILNAIQ